MRDQVIEFLGKTRAEKLEEFRPGIIDSAIRQMKAFPEKERPSRAAIYALQSVGGEPTHDDANKLRAAQGLAPLPAPRRIGERREREVRKTATVQPTTAGETAPAQTETPAPKKAAAKSTAK